MMSRADRNSEAARRGGTQGAGAPLRSLLAVAAWLACSAAVAEVMLDTAVSKVETTLDPGGRVQRALVPVDAVVAGDELRYTITFSNDSEVPVDPERIVITNPIPEGTVYVTGTAGGDAALVEYSTGGDDFSPAEPPSEPDSPSGSQARAEAPPGGDPAGQDQVSAVRSLRWTYQNELAPGQASEVYFHVRMQ